MDAIMSHDRDILRELVGRLAAAATEPVNGERKSLWRSVNDLKTVRPTLWINELPTDQLNINGELESECRSSWARAEEAAIRWQLLQWTYFSGDMIIPSFYESPIIIDDSGIGVIAQEYTESNENATQVVSHAYTSQFETIDDLEKIIMPRVTIDEKLTEENFHRRNECFGDILPVRQCGVRYYWFSPLDIWVMLRGPMNFLMDLMDQPELVDAAMARLTETMLVRLEQFRALGLLSANATNVRIGSGGYGYVSELPEEGDNLPAEECWGCSAAQMASEISPEMHEKYILKHELKWLKQWGLTYYGCCEPLHHKVEMLSQIPNLQKISMSPWTKPEIAAQTVADRYVYSFKPNPAFLAEDTFRVEAAMDELRRVLDIVWPAGCHVEVILKDVSTLRHEPQRLVQWHDAAMELLKQYTR